MLRRTSGNSVTKTCTIEATVHVPYSYDCWHTLEVADRYPEPLRKRYRLPSAPSMLLPVGPGMTGEWLESDTISHDT